MGGSSDNNAPRRSDASGGGPDSVVAFPRERVAQRAASNLPAELTSFVGREREIAEVEGLLADHRLLTLTGPGGSGKTRHALAVAFEVVERFEDGVWFVELASLSDPDLVPQAVASTLGVREAPGRPLTEMLYEHLRSRKMLLVLDNCEHLVEACAALSDGLLRFCPKVRILATSREALGIGGESAWLVPPLALPEPEQRLPVEELGRCEAIRLFVERAHAVASSFELTEVNAPEVARVCRRLDGNPLAIELAAARVRVLSVEQISSRLEESFTLLTGGSRTALPRQRTLRATIDWSYDLLSEEEQVLFRRLAVFAGGFGLEAAEKVCAGGDIEEADVLDLLTHLVDKSLVLVTERGGAARYRMLETVRQYGQERLEESGEDEEARRHHAAFYLALAEEAGPKLKGHDQAIWLGRLETELDNLRAALLWSVERGRGQQIAQMAWASWTYWWLSGHISEGRRWMEEALASEPEMPATSRARLQTLAATLGQALGDFESARLMNDESLELFRQLDDEAGMYFAMGTAGLIALCQGQPDEGLSLMEESGKRRLEMGDKWAASAMFGFSATVALGQGDHTRARRLAERALSLAREIGAGDVVSVALPTLATIARADGDRERAARLFEEGLVLSAEVGDRTNIAYYLEALAEISASEDRLEQAARLWGAAEALLETIEVIAYPHAADRSFYDQQLAAARARLEERMWEEAWTEGWTMTTEEAVGYALGTEEAAAPPPKDAAASLLSAREVEVLRLVAQGLTNPQVAERLYLSPRTVGQHLRSVYRKLGVPSRAAAAREASKRGLI